VSKNGSAGLKGWLDDVIKVYRKMHKHPLIMYTSTENVTSKIRMLFFAANVMTSRVFRGFERLSSSFWRLVMTSYSQGWNSPRLAFVGAKFWPLFGFWAIILDPDMLASQSRALKTRFRVSNPKKHWAKKIRIGLGPRARQSWPKIAQTCSHCDVTHKQPKIQAEFFFSISSRRLAESVKGLINSLALLVGKLWLAKVWATIVSLRSLKHSANSRRPPASLWCTCEASVAFFTQTWAIIYGRP